MSFHHPSVSPNELNLLTILLVESNSPLNRSPAGCATSIKCISAYPFATKAKRFYCNHNKLTEEIVKEIVCNSALCYEPAARVVFCCWEVGRRMAGCSVVIFSHLGSSINGLKNKCQSLGKAEVRILSVFDERCS